MSNINATDREIYVVQGYLVTDFDLSGDFVAPDDPEALRELNLPAGEAAVEIAISALPELETAHAG